MDMKKILQAMDGVSTKPVEGSNDMKKFVSIIQEGANPHKVALPVQMAMNHYQKPKAPVERKTRIIDKYFTEAEAAITQRKEEKRAKINQYASVIAERVLMKESKKSISEDSDPNKLAASVWVGGEFKEFDLTPFIAKNNWIGDPKTVIKQAAKWLGDFLRSKGLAYSNLKITYKGWVMNASQVGDAHAPMPEFESMAGVGLQPIDELSTELLGRYKKAAGADAKAADADSDFERGNKRFSGIVKATKKQFDNDAKKHKEQDISEDNAAATAPVPAPRISEADAETQIKQLQSTVYKELASIVWSAWPSILDTTFGVGTPADKPATPEQIGKMLGYRLAEYADGYRQKVRAIKTAAGVRDPQSLNKTSAAIYINEEQIDEEKQRNSK
jgi:hypothetical protein